MSGGEFSGDWLSFEGLAERLTLKVEERRQGGDAWRPEVTSTVSRIAGLAGYLALMAREVDLLLGEDTGEEAFLDRVREIESVYGAVHIDKAPPI